MPFSTSPSQRHPLNTSPYVAATAEATKNYEANEARTWYKDSADSDDPAGTYAFQRLRQTWFTPKVNPKFKLRRDDKFYAIGSCFARGLECLWQIGKLQGRGCIWIDTNFTLLVSPKTWPIWRPYT